AVVAPKGTLHIDATISSRTAPYGPAPGKKETGYSGQDEIAKQRRLQRRAQIRLEDRKEQQRRHAAPEHQRRGAGDKSAVDPADTPEHDAEKQHREYRSGDAECLNNKGRHG